MDNQSLDTLEFDDFRGLLSRYGQTPFGKKRLLEISPSTDLKEIELAHQEVSECAAYQREYGRLRIGETEDPAPILERLGIADTRLDPEEMLLLQSIISVGHSIKQQFREARDRDSFRALAAIIERIPNLNSIFNRLRSVLLPSGEINEDASPELRRLRREINSMRSRIYRRLEALIDQAGSEGAVRDEFVTVRNGRFVIPVRNDSRGRVPGVVHGLSSSGATAFVEPLATIEDNNELVRLKELEEAEIAKILFSLSEDLREELPNLLRLADALAALDVVISKTDFARDYDCVAPQMNLDHRLELIDARHPLLEHNLRRNGANVIPISLALDAKSSAMVISGPNAGGKTVVLKTVGLLALIAQSGLHVPAKSALLPVFAETLADIGDHQSIAANLSTFSSHITNIASMADQFLGNVKPSPALVLIDEVGTGTDPEEGAALGVAIVDYFKRNGAMVLVSTHYNPLKFYATQTSGVVNASVEFDEETLRPTYKLVTGVAGTSSGIEIAKRLGLQEEILETAIKTLDRKDLHQANFLKIIKTETDRLQQLNGELENERRALTAKHENLENEYAARERERLQEFDRKLSAVLKNYETQAADYIVQLKDPKLAAKLTKEREKRVFQLKKQAGELLLAERVSEGGHSTPSREIADLVSLSTEFNVGDRVETELGQQGVIEEIKGEDIFVRIGAMKYKAFAGALKMIERSAKKKIDVRAKLPSGVKFIEESSENVLGELNVIGCRTEEACERVDKFLDKAFLANFERVRIVHGSGEGRLRKAISEMLKNHPHVAEFHIAPSSEGGAGATIVELRQ